MPKCPYCGKEVEELVTLEIYINDESVGTAECCEECALIVEKATQDPNFGEIFHNFVVDLEQNWEKGTSANTKVGSLVKIIDLVDDPAKNIYIGKTGIVEKIDDAGVLHGTWGGLGIIQDTDSYLVAKVSNETEVKEND